MMADQAKPNTPPITKAITDLETGKQPFEIFQYVSTKISKGKKIITARLSIAKLYFPIGKIK